jgi:NAD-dependent deacetylase
MDCSKRIPLAPEHVSLMPYPSCDRCGTPLKPDVVFFGEGIPMRAVVQANDEAMRCKVLVIIGTSGVVYPAAEIPYASKANGAVVVEINVSPTPFTTSITDHYLEGSASEILPQITGRL